MGTREERCEILEIGKGGVFVSSLTRPALKQLVQLTTKLEDGSEFCASGMVSHVVDDAEARQLGVSPGIGIQFYGLGQTAAYRWRGFVESRVEAQRANVRELREALVSGRDVPDGVKSLAASRGIDPYILAAALVDERDTDVIKEPDISQTMPGHHVVLPDTAPEPERPPDGARLSSTMRIWSPYAPPSPRAEHPSASAEPGDELSGDTLLDISPLTRPPDVSVVVQEKPSAQDCIVTQPFRVVSQRNDVSKSARAVPVVPTPIHIIGPECDQEPETSCEEDADEVERRDTDPGGDSVDFASSPPGDEPGGARVMPSKAIIPVEAPGPVAQVAPWLALARPYNLAPPDPTVHVVYRMVLPSVHALAGFADSALGSGGVFVRTRDLRPAGTPAVVVVVHPLSRDEFHLPGEVVHVGAAQRGVGVKFIGLTDRTASEFRQFIGLGIPDDDASRAPSTPSRLGDRDSRELTLVHTTKHQRPDPAGPVDTHEVLVSKVEPLKKGKWKEKEHD